MKIEDFINTVKGEGSTILLDIGPTLGAGRPLCTDLRIEANCLVPNVKNDFDSFNTVFCPWKQGTDSKVSREKLFDNDNKQIFFTSSLSGCSFFITKTDLIHRCANIVMAECLPDVQYALCSEGQQSGQINSTNSIEYYGGDTGDNRGNVVGFRNRDNPNQWDFYYQSGTTTMVGQPQQWQHFATLQR